MKHQTGFHVFYSVLHDFFLLFCFFPLFLSVLHNKRNLDPSPPTSLAFQATAKVEKKKRPARLSLLPQRMAER